MIRNQKILAVILARGGSKGIKKKNIVDLDGFPLISYTIYAALKSKYVDKIVVSTDSNEIAKVSKEFGATVPFKRPKELSGDKITSVDALRHAAVAVEKKLKSKFDIVIELPCVAPMRNSKHIDEALEILIKKNYDSVTSFLDTGEKHPIRLKRIKNNIITNFCKEYPELNQISRRQDLEPCFIRNGAIYAMTRKCLVADKSRHGKKNYPYIMSSLNSVNIDSPHDLLIAKLLIKDGHCKNNPSEIKKKFIKTSKNKGKPKLLVSCETSFSPYLEKKINNNFDTVFERSLEKKEILKLLDHIDAWICKPTPNYKINKEILKKTQNLKIIATPSTGTNHIDLDFCKKRNIKVEALKNKKIINNIYASSEFTFAMLISFYKKIFNAQKITQKKLWRNETNENHLRNNELYSKTLGIIGCGRIGSNLAKYANSFSMKILAYDPFKKIKIKYIKQKKNYSEVIKNSDIVAICVHLNKSTKNMVNKKWFTQMKKEAILINSSRGEILNEKDLIQNLKKKKISGAIVDVISNEQKTVHRNHPMIKYSNLNQNLIITPHIAGLTVESEEKALKQSINDLITFFGK
jgi:D-3-phosphoglycerate dehydrogenase / 2-oxoglutarate reductase